MADDKDAAKQSHRARRRRSIAIAISLGGLVLLFFLMTVVRLKGHVVGFFE
ncbi:MAG TPA: hypothetical protein VII49_14060 [Rhizomicrobium sp.]